MIPQYPMQSKEINSANEKGIRMVIHALEDARDVLWFITWAFTAAVTAVCALDSFLRFKKNLEKFGFSFCSPSQWNNGLRRSICCVKWTAAADYVSGNKRYIRTAS